MPADDLSSPMDEKLDPNDPVVRDFLDRHRHLTPEEGIRRFQSTIEASEQAEFIRPRDHGPAKVATSKTGSAAESIRSSDPVQRNDLQLPWKLGRYTLVSEIGHGGFSRVYLGTRDGTDDRFAIKVFQHRWMDAIERLDIERLILQKLNHPNLVSAVDFGHTEDGTSYLVMPMIDGVRIDHYAQTGKLEYRRIAKLFSQLAAGLQYAHERGVIHRDLKPGNVLVSHQGIPIVTDFGLAKQFHQSQDHSKSLPSLTATGAILGTLGYLAPEQIQGGPEKVTAAVDIYGLGATLFRVLTGQTPGESQNLLKALRESQSRRATFSGDQKRSIPSSLRAICLKCLEKSPSDRYGSMRELQEDLESFAAGNPVRIRKVPWKARMRRWMETEPITAGLSLGLITVSLGGMLAVLWLWNAASQERTQVKAMLVTAREILNEGDRVAERSLGSVPGTLEFRFQRLEKSSDFFDRLLERYPNDTELLNDSAVSNFRLATVGLHLGRYDAARKKLRKAEEQFQRLVDTVPDAPDYRFDLFHCSLMHHYIHMAMSTGNSSDDRECLTRADQIISNLVQEFPDDTRYLDAQICVGLKLVDFELPTQEELIRNIYLAAVSLKKKNPAPCLEWRHAGTAARKMVLHFLEQLDSQKADEWLPIAEKETLEFLQRPKSVVDDRVDWIRYLEVACQAAYLRGDDALHQELRQQRIQEIEQCLSSMPDRPGFLILKENESTFFDAWIERAKAKRGLGDSPL
jgi:tetratricopeptide (TPR) repeat protein